MTADQYTQLIELLGRKFEAVHRRLDRLDRRVSGREARSTPPPQTDHTDATGDIGTDPGSFMSPAQLDCLKAYLNWWFDRLEGRSDTIKTGPDSIADIEARLQANADLARRRLEARRGALPPRLQR